MIQEPQILSLSDLLWFVKAFCDHFTRLGFNSHFFRAFGDFSTRVRFRSVPLSPKVMSVSENLSRSISEDLWSISD